MVASIQTLSRLYSLPDDAARLQTRSRKFDRTFSTRAHTRTFRSALVSKTRSAASKLTNVWQHVLLVFGTGMS